jgi:hypothetical protein
VDINVQPASYSTGTRVLPKLKSGNFPLPPIVEVKNDWSYTSAPLICLDGLDMENSFKGL